MRYVKVPVVFDQLQHNVWAQLECKCEGYDNRSTYGVGPTEDEAFADLLRKLGYEEVNANPTYNPTSTP